MVKIIIGRSSLGFFKPGYTPTRRGFDQDEGLFQAAGDHYEHMAGGYDWHVNDEIDFSARGIYSGNLVRDASVKWIKEQQESTKPFFLYVPFQECHSPFQVDQMYKDLYPQLANSTVRQTLAGMVTHTDEMIGDIITALKATAQWNNTLVFFSADNGTRCTMHPFMVTRCKICIHTYACIYAIAM